MTEPQTSQPAAPSDSASKKPYHGSGPGGYSWKWILLAALGVYALLLIIQNSKHVPVSFVFFSQKTRVIYLVLLCVALGALITWLIPRMRSGRKKKRGSSSAGSTDAKGTGPGGISWKAILLGALGIYALLLIILNRRYVELDFVFFSERTRLIFLVLLSMALGALIVLVVRRMRRDRKKRSTSASAGPPRDDTPAPGADVTTGSG